MNITDINVALSFGADKKGVEKGPAALIGDGLISLIESFGNRVVSTVNISQKECDDSQKYAHGEPKAKWLPEVLDVASQVRNAVSECFGNGSFPLVIGGDHSLALGSAAASLERFDNLGVIWFDAHADMNTFATSPTGNIHGMVLASLMGMGDEALRKVVRRYADPTRVLLVGARSIDPGESQMISQHGISVAQYMSNASAAILQFLVKHEIKNIHLSIDIDLLDPSYAPGTGVPVPNGASPEQVYNLLRVVMATGMVRAVDLVEYNPDRDIDGITSASVQSLMYGLWG